MNIILISRLNRHSQVMEEWISKYGKVFGFYKGTVPHVVISDADLIKECFIKESAAFYDRPPAILPVKPYTDMLLFLRGADWKHVRTVLNPSFSAAKMKLMTPIISRCVEDFMSVMERKADTGEAINVMEAAQGLSLDVIANCALAWQSAAMMLALVGSVAALLVTWVLLWIRGRRKAHGFLRAAGIEGPPPDLLWGNWKQLKEDRIADFKCHRKYVLFVMSIAYREYM
ncbi:hypothetical protein HPB48_018859 [Haemaphysalis longicornis]|uniref:Cytochrome P450 n=1 Tax=Haemaphysalis longicornis TaxID=44386 RepID=A0A9J6FBP8_HAELO|nr:hypothetical protein HPB48_018859 [Haemaphysalis longicornis]